MVSDKKRGNHVEIFKLTMNFRENIDCRLPIVKESPKMSRSQVSTILVVTMLSSIPNSFWFGFYVLITGVEPVIS